MVTKSDVQKFAAANSTITEILPSGKLRFLKTAMDFPAAASMKVLKAYKSGRAYRRALAKQINDEYDFSAHEPYIVPHKHRDERHFLYCTLTNVTLPRQRGVIESHVASRRYLRLMGEVEKRREERARVGKIRKEKREKARKGRGCCENEDCDTMEEDVLEGVLSSESESEHSDIEIDDVKGNVAKKGKKKKSGRAQNGSAQNGSAQNGSAHVSGKRNRIQVAIPKKVLRARQRRKLSHMELA